MKATGKKFRISTAQWVKREFDPASKTDLAEYQHFLEKGRWRDGCPFTIDWPYLDVIKSIEDRVARFYIGNLVKSAKKA